jgi:hypothetical protein
MPIEHFTQENIINHIYSVCDSTPYVPAIEFRDSEIPPSKHQTIMIHFIRHGQNKGGCKFSTRELYNNKEWKQFIGNRMRESFKLLNSRVERLAEAVWNYYYPEGGSIYADYGILPLSDKEKLRKDAAQIAAFLDGRLNEIGIKEVLKS